MQVFSRIVASVRPQFAAVRHLAVHDIPFQLSAGLLICGLCWYAGNPQVAIAVALTLIVSESCVWQLMRNGWPFHSLSRDAIIITSLCICSINAVLYPLPALFLASHPSLALKTVALLWILGAQVYIINGWTRVPVFLFGMLVPSMVMLVLAFLRLDDTAPQASSSTHWGIAFCFLLMFGYSAIDTLRAHMATQASLLKAEQESATRLARLQETHRLDALTGLLNRTAFDSALAVMLQDRVSDGGEISVFLVDLDAFKPINDTYSHEAGDFVLTQTAQRIQTRIGDRGIVGRLGGDEFICAVHDLNDDTEALAFAAILTHDIAQPIEWKNRTLKTSASIGVSMSGDGPSAPRATVSALCSAADQAMFAAKSSPSGAPLLYQSHLFAPRMTPEDKQALIEGIATRTIRPFYQPKIHLPTGQIIGFEALVRWNHPRRGVCEPADFIDQISELGLQGDFMICMACQVIEDIETMLGLGLDPGQVSLNVSEVALATYTGQQDLHAIVTDHPEAAKHLTFEITEDVFIARAADTIQASITSFRKLGVRISLDDFGTGFASFHHLRQLEFDEMKIDTSFVAGLGQDTTAEVLVRGFLNIASGLGVGVIAEGVETEDQRRELLNMGCITAQGFLFSPAVPYTQATELLSQQQAA